MVIANRQLRFPGQDAGGWNRRKWKCLFILNERARKGQGSITMGHLADLTGVDRVSLTVALAKWVKWGYVSRQGTVHNYRYTLLAKGKKFLDWAAVYISLADRQKWLDEIIEAQKVLGR